MGLFSLGSIAGIDRVVARMRARVAELGDRVVGTLRPQPDGRADGTSNAEVLARLAARYPALTAPGADLVAAALREARATWRPWSSSLRDLGDAALRGLARGLAARLRAGTYVTNAPSTLAAKVRRGRPPIPGVDTEQLAQSLDAATSDLSE